MANQRPRCQRSHCQVNRTQDEGRETQKDDGRQAGQSWELGTQMELPHRVATVADALDLIERRLFGFKNGNQIHLNLSHFSFLPVSRSFWLPLCCNYTALDSRSAEAEDKRGGEEEGRKGIKRQGSSFYIACILNKCSLSLRCYHAAAVQISALTPLWANKRLLTLAVIRFCWISFD